MAGILSGCFLSHGGWSTCNVNARKHASLRFCTSSYPRLLTVSCKIRKRDPSVPPLTNFGTPQFPQNDNFMPYGGSSYAYEKAVSNDINVANSGFDDGNPSSRLTPITGANNVDGLSTAPLQDVMRMIHDAEKDIQILSQAHTHALKSLETINVEKDALQRELNMLETRLNEADVRKRSLLHKIRYSQGYYGYTI